MIRVGSEESVRAISDHVFTHRDVTVTDRWHTYVLNHDATFGLLHVHTEHRHEPTGHHDVIYDAPDVHAIRPHVRELVSNLQG